MNHLTDAQIADLLANSSEAAEGTAAEHLQLCAHCQAELAVLRSSITSLRTATTAFAAGNAPAYAPRQAASPQASATLRRYAWAGSLATAAAMLAVSVSLLHTPAPGGQAAPAPAVTAAATAASVSDDALLAGIQQDLSTSIPPSLEPLDVQSGSIRTSR